MQRKQYMLTCHGIHHSWHLKRMLVLCTLLLLSIVVVSNLTAPEPIHVSAAPRSPCRTTAGMCAPAHPQASVSYQQFQGTMADSGGQWTTETSLPVAREEMGVTTAGGKVYLIGGKLNSTTLTNSVIVYDPLLHAWSSVAPVPGPARDHIGVANLNGHIYAIGGLITWPAPSIPSLYEYDPATNVWTQKADMPDPRPRSGIPNRGRGAMGVA